jgi:hypothetical protein
MAVPYTFGSATTSIPLSQLDSNFATTITLGNTAIQLGNTVTTLNNMTLANVTISSGTSNLASTSISNGTSNVTIASSGGAIAMATNGATAITVDTSQNVGVGVTPSAWYSTYRALSIGYSSNGMFSGGATQLGLTQNAYLDSGINWIYTTTNPASQYTQASGVHTWRSAASGTAGTAISFNTGMTLNASGVLGVTNTGANGSGAVNAITITNPGTSAGDGPRLMFLSGTSTTGGCAIAGSGVALNSADMLFYAGGNTERMRIDTSGSLLINKTSRAADESFGITGKLNSQCVQLVSPTTGGYDQINFRNPNGQVGLIGSSGSSTSYGTSSDYRLKENIAPMTGALAKVAQLKPVTYKWKIDSTDGEGFIAHELAEVCPSAVSGEKDAVETYLDDESNEQTRIKPQGIDTSFLVATLTAAIQELKAINDTQTTTITALTARIVALEAK